MKLRTIIITTLMLAGLVPMASFIALNFPLVLDKFEEAAANPTQ